jgi:hypothetical protein
MTTDSLSQIGYFVKDWAILVNGPLTGLPFSQAVAGRPGSFGKRTTRGTRLAQQHNAFLD